MKEASTIGVDLAKNVFQLHGAHALVEHLPPPERPRERVDHGCRRAAAGPMVRLTA